MKNIANKLCSGALALAMFIGAAPTTMAAGIFDGYDIGDGGTRNIDLVSNIQLVQSTAGSAWEEQKIVTTSSSASKYTFNYAAKLNMQPVRDAYNSYIDFAEELIALAPTPTPGETSYSDLLEDIGVTGEFTITIGGLSQFDMSATGVTTDIPADGITDEQKAEILGAFTTVGYGGTIDVANMAAAPSIYEAVSRDYDEATGTLTIVIKIADGTTKAKLDEVGSLGDFALVCKNVSVSGYGTHTITGAISGSTTISGDVSGSGTAADLGTVTYTFGQDTGITQSLDGTNLAATIKINQSTSSGGGGGGGGGASKATIYVYNEKNKEVKKEEKSGTAALDLTALDFEALGLIKDNALFEGWYTDQNRKNPVTDSPVTTTKTVKLYPKYIPTGSFDIEFYVDDVKAPVNTMAKGSVEVEADDITTTAAGALKINTDEIDVVDTKTIGWYSDSECTIPFDASKNFALSDYPDGIIKIYTKTDAEEDVDKPIKVFDDEDHFAYIIGYPDGTVRPEAHMTREEVTTMIYRLLTDEERTLIYATTNDFPDVADTRWSNITISTMANGGEVQGYPDGEFKPENDITRAEFVTMLVRFFDYAPKGECTFEDSIGHWAEEYITIAQEHQWITGDDDAHFRPDDAITRAEVMTVINRLLNRHVDFEGMLDVIENWIDNPDDAWYYYEVLEATRSHEYERAEGEVFETWTARKADRDWTSAEHHNAE